MKGENGHKNYFMINLHEIYEAEQGFELADLVPTTLGSPAV